MSKSKNKYEGLRYPPLNELIDKVHNKYELVLAASKRARDLVDGALPLINYENENPISIATEEIDEGKINLENPVLDKLEEELSQKTTEDILNDDKEVITSSDIEEDQTNDLELEDVEDNDSEENQDSEEIDDSNENNDLEEDVETKDEDASEEINEED